MHWKRISDRFSHLLSIVKTGIVNMNKDAFTREELKEALKKFKHTEEKEQEGSGDKKKFRSMNEIKEELKGLNTDIKTDIEIIREMLKKYQAEDVKEEDKLHFLSEFEFYLHQIDNAIDFMDMGGFDMMVKDLNHTSDAIRKEAALVIGSATQSNPKVQVHALKSGLLPKLIRMMSIEITNTLRLKALFAISCIIRNFPHAQEEFISHGGIQVLTDMFRQPGTGKLRLKAVTLAVDMLNEKEYAELHANQESKDLLDKLQQYRRVPLKRVLQEHGWCDSIPELLASQEHDTREKVLNLMKHLAELCPDFVDDQWRLITLRTQYKKLSEAEVHEDPSDDYFTQILNLVEELFHTLEGMKNKMLKDEL